MSEAAAIERDGDGRLGCLLLHGLTGTPHEVLPLADRLSARGVAVSAPLLPGHGTRVDDLVRTTWHDWFAVALAAWDRLAAKAPQGRVAAGVSMGGLLTLHLAHERPGEIAAAALLAPAFVLRAQRNAEVAFWLSHLPWLPRRFEIVSKGPRDRVSLAYDHVAMRAVGQLVRLQRRVASELATIRTPVLVLEGDQDTTVATGSAAAIEAALVSAVKRRVLVPNARHVLTEGPSAAAVMDEIERFFESNVSGGLGLG